MTADTHARPAGFEEPLVSAALAAALSLAQPTPVFAIAGLQGSGKSTLAAQIAAFADARGHRVAVLSIDDFYLRKDQRLQLAREVHPLLATRGPPGTHDLGLALETIGSLRDGRPTRLPRFDKLADDREPAARWPAIEQRCDFVLLEGWFLKTPPQNPDELLQSINALERDEDPDGSWRRWCNAALADDYPNLWRTIDALWFLQGPDFDVVPGWRWQQELSLQAGNPERAAMSRAQVEHFVQLFERVSRQALRTLPTIADKTVVLDEQRRPL
jgi:D-glycerate 3-kinase